MTSDVAAEGKHRFWMLDLLRGASAILVLVYHSSNAFPVAYAAVDLFFMLSGFVLAERYGESLLQAGGRRDFINHRIARLYPVYFACTLLGAVSVFPLIGHLENWSINTFAVSSVTSLLMLPAPSDTVLGILPLNGPAWSLFFEVVANVVFLVTAARLRVAVFIVALSARQHSSLLYGTFGTRRAPSGAIFSEAFHGCWYLFTAAYLSVIFGDEASASGLPPRPV
ncbi:MAG: acyltransferase family protein [Rhizobium sp.]|uniref:acyltransferase family protein n=1 Tax=Rhizobium sp. TaxID=391 RepID=UPI00389ACAF0